MSDATLSENEAKKNHILDGFVETERNKNLIKNSILQDAIFNSAFFSSIATDEKGVIQIFNVGAERMLGYSAYEVVNLLTPADLSDANELISRAATLTNELQTSITPGFEALVFKASRGIEDIYDLTYVRKDRSRFPAAVSVTALRDIQASIIGYLIIGTDNTARKTAEETQKLLSLQLDKHNADLQLFRTAMDATADAILFLNRTSMRIVEANATACKMLGYERSQLFEINPSILYNAIDGQLESMYDTIIAGSGSDDLRESQICRKDGSVLSVEVQRHAQRAGDDWILVGVLRDITERKAAEKHLNNLAYYDAITGLPNRTYFFDTLKKALLQVSHKTYLGVLFVDLDHFKNVNDTLGHAVGDELLRQVSMRLLQCVRIRDTVGRIGGDEFALILLMQEDGQQGAAAVANKIQEALCTPFNLDGHEVNVTASIGITLHPDDCSDPQTLLKYADTAMYSAKKAGRDTYRFFTPKMNSEMLVKLDLEIALRKAVQNDEFVLYYQPQINLKSGCISGFEALIRWERPGFGLVMPNDFIPALEDSGLIVRVGSWVIEKACMQLREWIKTPIGNTKISVNVSSRQFIEGDIEATVTGALSKNGIPGNLLELELTESTLMVNTETTIEKLQNLKKLGIQISIDDFGTGYSSLAYLRRFPIDNLKIDIAFIRGITSNPEDAAIARAVIRMAHSLKLKVIAEGVEELEQLTYLQKYRCDHVQGFLYSKSLPVKELEQFFLKLLNPTNASLSL